MISEASRHGIRWTAEPVEPLETPWPYPPDRSDEPTGVRVSVIVSLSVASSSPAPQNTSTRAR
jgi:hypothetical protein